MVKSIVKVMGAPQKYLILDNRQSKYTSFVSRVELKSRMSDFESDILTIGLSKLDFFKWSC